MNRRGAVMNPEFSAPDRDRMVSPHAREIEYALILSRMINTIKDDPSQIRWTIYEFARARLQIDSGWADQSERERLASALETAIQGVEDFSARREEKDRLRPPLSYAQIGHDSSPAAQASPLTPKVQYFDPATEDIVLPRRVYPRSAVHPVLRARTRWSLARFWIGMLLFGVVAAFAFSAQRLPASGGLNIPALIASIFAKPVATPVALSTAQPPAPPELKTATISPSSQPFPTPSDYGMYALNNGVLSELYLLPARVPDKRIAMSTPVNEPSRTTLADGKAKFVLFRRDLIGNAPERMEVRVVARVTRALTFDSKGKASFSPVTDAWNIRNISYEFRVRPIAGNPEMLLVQSEKPDFALPPGRYVLVFRDQGYDFSVPGKVTDLSQCLERTDAANGAFYSECQKQ